MGLCTFHQFHWIDEKLVSNELVRVKFWMADFLQVNVLTNKGACNYMCMVAMFQYQTLQRSVYPREIQKRRQRGRVIGLLDLKSGNPGFKSRSGHYLDLSQVVPGLSPRLRL